MMENALRFPHTHSHDYDDEDGQRQLAPTGQLLNVRRIIDVTISEQSTLRLTVHQPTAPASTPGSFVEFVFFQKMYS